MSLSLPIFSRVMLLVAAGLCAPAWSQDAAPAGLQRVRLETTLGAFTVEVDPARAPITSASFLQYVRDLHYDGTIFHRVIGNFVIQGGGYLPDGAEKPVRGGVPNESGNGLSNRRGTVALARTGDPHSGTSQFYVNVADNIALDPSPARWGYAVFGRVVEGMDVVDRIASVATGSSGQFQEDAPVQPVVISTARIVGETATTQ
ncbi:MAG: peptidyl-prolyl cis-trans isomerase [Proteobacteria bacterium]|nr:peptidyl-prolyl cis-trans isomerase [Pseudomonadota bacterium]